ncbi:hypothetical protein BC628DRAFT_1115124 [Trametes gibbosa]|nr:hypothetical protein BC628DRAFT_1115124 [Trametes gibbosa]
MLLGDDVVGRCPRGVGALQVAPRRGKPGKDGPMTPVALGVREAVRRVLASSSPVDHDGPRIELLVEVWGHCCALCFGRVCSVLSSTSRGSSLPSSFLSSVRPLDHRPSTWLWLVFSVSVSSSVSVSDLDLDLDSDIDADLASVSLLSLYRQNPDKSSKTVKRKNSRKDRNPYTIRYPLYT